MRKVIIPYDIEIEICQNCVTEVYNLQLVSYQFIPIIN